MRECVSACGEPPPAQVHKWTSATSASARVFVRPRGVAIFQELWPCTSVQLAEHVLLQTFAATEIRAVCGPHKPPFQGVYARSLPMRARTTQASYAHEYRK